MEFRSKVLVDLKPETDLLKTSLRLDEFGHDVRKRIERAFGSVKIFEKEN